MRKITVAIQFYLYNSNNNKA